MPSRVPKRRGIRSNDRRGTTVTLSILYAEKRRLFTNGQIQSRDNSTALALIPIEIKLSDVLARTPNRPIGTPKIT